MCLSNFDLLVKLSNYLAQTKCCGMTEGMMSYNSGFSKIKLIIIIQACQENWLRLGKGLGK